MIDTRHGLVLVTAPTEEPITLGDAKHHCRVEVADEDDDLISALITAARLRCEQELGQAFCTQTWRLTLDCFPDEFVVPMPPLVSVTHLKYRDTSGTLQTLASTGYSVDTDSRPGRVSLAYGEVWPSTRAMYNAVQLTYVAGYGDASAVPENIKLAIRLLVGAWYEFREQIMEGGTSELPMSVGVSSLLLSSWHGSY